MRTIALIILICILAGIGVLYFTQQEKRQPTDRLFLSGNIEITEVDVSFKIPGRVSKRFVDEGDVVQAGDPVAQLDSEDLIHEVDLRQADVNAAKALLEEAENGYLPEMVAQAEAKVKQANASLKRQKDDYERQRRLYQQQVISPREFELSETAYTVAQATQDAANQQLELLKNGIRPEKKDQARAQLDKAKQGLNLAQIKLSYSDLASPLTGFVLTKNVEPGEIVAPGIPIVTVGDLENVWLRGYINETDLSKVQLGQKAQITTDTFPDKIYEGKVTFISPQAEFTPRNVQTEQERVKLVYRVKIDIPNPHHELKPGMPADATIWLNPDSTSPNVQDTHEPTGDNPD